MSDDRLRLDKWLWHARMCKTRAQAAALCDAGAVILNGQVVRKPAQLVKTGDRITIPRGASTVTLAILALGSRRGPFAEASALYFQEGGAPARASAWEPLLADEEAD